MSAKMARKAGAERKSATLFEATADTGASTSTMEKVPAGPSVEPEHGDLGKRVMEFLIEYAQKGTDAPYPGLQID
jgi:hypothetical protein